MTFERLFRASSYCMLGSGFAAIAASGSVDSISILLFSAVFIARLVLDITKREMRIPVWMQNCVSLAYLVFFFYDLRVLSRSLMPAAIHLLFFVAAIKLLTLARDRDYVQLFLISFAQILAASILTVNIVFAICLLVFLFCAINALILFEMRRSYAKMREGAMVRPLVTRRALEGNSLELFSPFPSGIFSITTIGITLLVIVLAIPFFFVFPRVTRGLYRQPSGDTQFVSGFTERVELGQIGAIKQSDAVVMRVKTSGTPGEIPPELKWRGIAFDHFDGRSWIRTDRNQTPIPTQGHYYKLETSTQGTRWLNQTFFVEAMPANVVFAARKVLAVSRDIGSLRKDFAGSLYTDPHLSRKLRYSAISDLIRPDAALISDLLPIPAEIRNTYLQHPSGDPRIEELAKSVTGNAPNRYAKAHALQQYLRSHYGYSLVLRGTPNSKDPIAMFLFEIRQGHCEYFASAMTLMLRQLGIPARLVNGFRAGEYNSLGNNWIVRQYDAHSWVEAYFPPYGWLEFDPTPAEYRGDRSAFSRLISNIGDAVDLWWWEGIVNYDSTKQYGVISTLYSGLERGQSIAKEFMAGALDKGRQTVSWIRSQDLLTAIRNQWFWVLLVAPLAVGALVRRWRRQLWGWIFRALHHGNDRIAAASFYREALGLLSDHGYKLDRGQTPLEFAQSLHPHPSHDSFLALTQMYNSLRFGAPGKPFGHKDAQTQLRLLRNALRKAPPQPAIPE